MPMILTPIQLVYALVERVRDMFVNTRMAESDGEHSMRAPNVWAQMLPEKRYDDTPDPTDYPFVVVMLGGGEGINGGNTRCNIAIWVCGYDDGLPISDDPQSVRDQQGWTSPAMMAWRIITSLAADQEVGIWSVDMSALTWTLPTDNQPAPQWHGVINTAWSAPIPIEHDYDLENMPSHGYKPCCHALSEDVNLKAFMEGD